MTEPTSLVRRVHPARVDIHIPPPGVAGKPFAAPGLWAAAHANNLRRMMSAAGYEEIGYEPADNDGKGSTLSFVHYAPEVTPGEIPREVQAYLEQHLGGDFMKSLKIFVRSAKAIVGILSRVLPFPPLAVILGPTEGALDAAGEILDSLPGDDDA